MGRLKVLRALTQVVPGEHGVDVGPAHYYGCELILKVIDFNLNFPEVTLHSAGRLPEREEDFQVTSSPTGDRRRHESVPYRWPAGLEGGCVSRIKQVRGRVKSTRTRPGNAYLKGALGIAAMSAARSRDTNYAARYRRIASRRGPVKAVETIEHAMLIAVWNMLQTGETFNDLHHHDWHSLVGK